jgi:hypothetical protein
MDLGEKGWGGIDWIGLAQDRDHWRALANAVMNFSVHKMLEGSSVVAQLVAYREGLSFAESVLGVEELRSYLTPK